MGESMSRCGSSLSSSETPLGTVTSCDASWSTLRHASCSCSRGVRKRGAKVSLMEDASLVETEVAHLSMALTCDAERNRRGHEWGDEDEEDEEPA